MIGIIDFGSKKTPLISQIISQIGFENRVVEWDKIENINWNDYNKIILSGAPILLTQINYEKYLKDFDFIKRYKNPILGICFGHQLIGLLFGAEVFLGVESRKETEIDCFIENKLFKNIAPNSKMMEDHTEGIYLPNDFKVIAKSMDYEVEAMKHNTKEIYGVQFHPEVSGENGMQLLTNFCKL